VERILPVALAATMAAFLYVVVSAIQQGHSFFFVFEVTFLLFFPVCLVLLFVVQNPRHHN